MSEATLDTTVMRMTDSGDLSLKKINMLLSQGIPFSGTVNVGSLKIEGANSGLLAGVVNDGTNNALVVKANVLPLPTGAASAAKQDTAQTTLDALLVELGQKTEPANQQHVIVDSSALPATASTAALQTTGNTSVGNVDTNLGAKADASAATDTGTFSLISLFKRLLEKTTTIAANVISKATSSIRSYFPLGTFVGSTALEADHVIKASAGNGLRVSGMNTLNAQQWIQVHDAASAPADTAVPKIARYVLARDNFVIDLTGIQFTNGIYVCNSTTGPTKTIGAANCWFEGLYE